MYLPPVPSTPDPPLKFSALTDPSFAKFRTPNTRVSIATVRHLTGWGSQEEDEEERDREGSPEATEEDEKGGHPSAKV